MALLPATYPLDLKRFHFDPIKRTLSAEASDFGSYQEIRRRWIQRLYDDACDVGIVIKSHFTEKEERFVLEREDRDDEGDLQCWHFVPVSKLARVETVTIFND